jgi:hypothetical protein
LSFLDALKEFITKGSSSGDQAKIVIFNSVNQLLNEFISVRINKNSLISDIRFDELRNITIEKLIKEGFKSVCKNAKDDEDAKKRISHLIDQYYDKQYLTKNLHIQQLNDDVKEILNQFSNLFPQIGKSKFTHRKIITLSDDVKIESFKDYPFSKNEPKKSRLKDVFFTIYEVLDIKKSIAYSDLITALKSKLGLFDNEEIAIPDSIQSRDGYGNNDELFNGLNDGDIPGIEFEITDDNLELRTGSILEDPNLISSGLEIFEFDDSNIIVITFKEFLNLCTEKQRIIFGVYLLKENAAINEESSVKEYKEYFKKLVSIFNISPQTLYYENNKAADNLDFVIKRNGLDHNQKQTLIRMLIDEFKKYFNKDGIK